MTQYYHLKSKNNINPRIVINGIDQTLMQQGNSLFYLIGGYCGLTFCLLLNIAFTLLRGQTQLVRRLVVYSPYGECVRFAHTRNGVSVRLPLIFSGQRLSRPRFSNIPRGFFYPGRHGNDPCTLHGSPERSDPQTHAPG